VPKRVDVFGAPLLLLLLPFMKNEDCGSELLEFLKRMSGFIQLSGRSSNDEAHEDDDDE
jgi:hypothetical protein